MKVEYDSSLTSRDAIIKAVGKLGYRVPLANGAAPEAISSTRSVAALTPPAQGAPAAPDIGRGGERQQHYNIALYPKPRT